MAFRRYPAPAPVAASLSVENGPHPQTHFGGNWLQLRAIRYPLTSARPARPPRPPALNKNTTELFHVRCDGLSAFINGPWLVTTFTIGFTTYNLEAPHDRA